GHQGVDESPKQLEVGRAELRFYTGQRSFDLRHVDVGHVRLACLALVAYRFDQTIEIFLPKKSIALCTLYTHCTACCRSDRRPHLSPLRGRMSALWITIGQQHRELVRQELSLHFSTIVGPVIKSPLGKPLVAEPKALPIIHQKLDGVRSTVTDHEDRIREGN